MSGYEDITVTNDMLSHMEYNNFTPMSWGGEISEATSKNITVQNGGMMYNGKSYDFNFGGYMSKFFYGFMEELNNPFTPSINNIVGTSNKVLESAMETADKIEALDKAGQTLKNLPGMADEMSEENDNLRQNHTPRGGKKDPPTKKAVTDEKIKVEVEAVLINLVFPNGNSHKNHQVAPKDP